jgi:hypothetical protein
MAQLLSSLPIGAKVKFGKHSINGETAQDITWLVVAKNHSGYPSNSVTLLTQQIIDLRAVDAAEPTNSDLNRQGYGNNTYSLSNINQWLNSNEDSWYTPTHSVDHAPDNAHTDLSTGYDTRPGFLSNFTSSEIAAILQTPLIAIAHFNTTESLISGVFLPSVTEVGFDSGLLDGSAWKYFKEDSSRRASITAQCKANTMSTAKYKEGSYWNWGLRSAYHSTVHYMQTVTDSGELSFIACRDGDCGIRPVVNLDGAEKVSDVTDSDGCYTMILNLAPAQPATFNVPTIYGGKLNSISWSNATDPEGDALTYQLECSVNGGAYKEIYSGTSTIYAHLVPLGTNSVAYRVKATDPSGESSAYKTSATITVINNNAPVISGSDANLGIKSEGFTGTYTITDANSDAVTVTESIDGVQIRSLVATLGQAITYGVTENTWLALPNGSHTLTIRATDGIDNAVRTYTFTKLVESFTIRNSTPWVSSTMPSRIMLVITRNIPSAATFKVEVCNNGYDASPTWEDCTDAVKSGLVHVFANTAKTATNWGVLVRVTVERNGATGACYVSAIGGNFE